MSSNRQFTNVYVYTCIYSFSFFNIYCIMHARQWRTKGVLLFYYVLYLPFDCTCLYKQKYSTRMYSTNPCALQFMETVTVYNTYIHSTQVTTKRLSIACSIDAQTFTYNIDFYREYNKLVCSYTFLKSEYESALVRCTCTYSLCTYIHLYMICISHTLLRFQKEEVYIHRN